jgi:branched-chain amino acid transport system substrate-binding protein
MHKLSRFHLLRAQAPAMLALPAVLAACTSGAIGARPGAGAPAQGDIVFGVSGPLTGNSAEYGRQWTRAFDLAVEEINGKGGINGRKLRYVFEDSQSDPKQSVVVAQKFVADPRIVVELGDFSSTASMAASPIYQRAGLVQLGFTNSHPDFTKGGDYMWSPSRGQKDEAPIHADFAVRQLGLKRLGVLVLNNDWGKATADLFAPAAKEYGAEVVAQEAYLPNEQDFRSPLTKMRDARPDGLALISYYADGALIAQQMRSLGINLPSVAAGSCYSPQFLKLGGEAVNGIYIPTSFFPDDPRPEVQTFVKAFRTKYGEDPDLFNGLAYDAIKLAAHVVERYGADRKAVKDGLGKVQGFPSVVYGTIAFNEERRVSSRTYSQIVVKGGAFVPWDGKKPGA